VPVALGVLAAGFAYEALQSRAATTEIVVARSAVSEGVTVDVGNTRLVKIRSADRSLLQDLVPPSDLEEGWVAAVPIRPGEPVTSSELARRPSGPQLGEMSIAVPVDEAVGGRLAAGDRVDVIASGASGSAHYVAQGLRVLAVAPTSVGGALLEASASYYVVVAVGKKTALRLAAALGSQAAGGSAAGGLSLVRSNGEAVTARTSFAAPTTPPGAASYSGSGTSAPKGAP
jgi:Flp pilus assembly protein CpaB